ncbi:hypothetical protein [Natrarchaeobius chitinivorans]|uniref:hypothetical protein n=1 Tax=Natrarchaeobius chitinivorans TaxID=1679083 RepID=UPI000F534253|nr:hypothetical protein [Natrarchaeobius chitinivorans]
MERRQFIAGIGVVTTFGLSGCASDLDVEEEPETEPEEEAEEGDETANGNQGFQVRVVYDGDWAGAAGTEGSTSSIEGHGEEIIDVDDSDIISANAQKQDDSDRELVIQILEDGEVVAEESTTAGYGVAQVTHDDFGF